MNKSFLIKISVLATITGVNIFSSACLSWGNSPYSTIPNYYLVNGTDYLNKLKCAEALNLQISDKNFISDLRIKTEADLKYTANQKFSIDKDTFNKLNSIAAQCGFSTLI